MNILYVFRVIPIQKRHDMFYLNAYMVKKFKSINSNCLIVIIAHFTYDE